MNPLFDPANASLTLRWTVAQVPEGDTDDEKSLEVTDDITTEPASPRACWHVSQLLEVNSIGLVAGEYALRYAVEGGLQVLSMPTQVGEDGRRDIIKAFTPSMAEEVGRMAHLFENAPTDEQIAEGAKEIVAAALHSLLEPKEDGDDSQPLTMRAMVKVKPGFIHVTESECSQCGGRGIPQMDPSQGMLGALSVLANLILGDPEVTTVGFGTGSAFIEPNGTGVNVKIGFASHGCPYALHFNGLLAAQMRDAVAKAEVLVISKLVAELLPKMRREVTAIESLAASFKIELPEADATQPQA